MSEGKRVVRQYPVEFKVNAAPKSLGAPQINITDWGKQYREGRLVFAYKRTRLTAEEAELQAQRLIRPALGPLS